MKRGLAISPAIVSLLLSCSLYPIENVETEFERASVCLNGQWQRLSGHGDEEVWNPEVAARLGDWEVFDVPGRIFPENKKPQEEALRFVWVKKEFSLSEADAARGAVLKWNLVRFGATAWINGREVTDHPTIGPHTALLPSGALLPGDNSIVMKIPGWASIPKTKSNYPLVPTASGPAPWGFRSTHIGDDIWIEFYDRAYIGRALAMPDIEGNSVAFRVELDGVAQLPESIELTARVYLQKEKGLVGQSKRSVPGGREPFSIDVPLKNVMPWTPETPDLYVAELRAEDQHGVCDEVRFTFGMREIEVVGGHYRLNGKPLRFRGSVLLYEWDWMEEAKAEPKRYMIDEARNMNLNSFRTHTIPPINSWLEIADEHGMMIWAELPVLYNFIDPHYTPEEREIFHRNVLLDAQGWVTKLWNHPSVVMWVLSNETGTIEEARWEAGPYWELVKKLDPTRPTMRTALPRGRQEVGTKENLDIHTCGTVKVPPEGKDFLRYEKYAEAKDPERSLTNSEYMNGWPGQVTEMWLGSKNHPDALLNYAEFGMEHTEAMRRLDYDGILPYMYAGWPRFRGSNWRPDFPTPMAAALHSSMSPVLASLDLFDRNFVAGEEIETRLALISERPQDVAAKLDIYITPENPLFVPDSDALAAAIEKQSFDLVFKSWRIDEMTIRWTVPQKQGIYYLAAVVREEGKRPVVSQRTIRSFAKPEPGEGLREGGIVLLGGDETIETWLKEKRIPYTSAIPKGSDAAKTALIWDVGRMTDSERPATSELLDWIRDGGKLVVLDQEKWTWKELADFELSKGRYKHKIVNSRAFLYEGVEHPMFAGYDPEWFRRWNGLPGDVAARFIEGPALEKGKKLLRSWSGTMGWSAVQEATVALSLPEGDGEILICLLHIKPRIDKTAEKYDPAAEQLLLNLLAAR